MLNLPEHSLREALSIAADSADRYSRVEQLAALLDELEVGLASVDPEGDFATVNDAGASLLGIRPGKRTATEFAEVMRSLASRAINHKEAVEQLRAVERDPAAEFRTTWAFGNAPTHLGVLSQPAPFAGFNGRIWAFYDNSVLAEALDAGRRADALVRARTDGMLDPQVLLEGVWRDGEVVDLIYRDVNVATCEYLGMDRAELIGQSLLRSLPNIDGSGLLSHYTRCAQTGEPVILDGFPYYNEVLNDFRYYDVRGAQVQPGWMTLTWRDVTERSQWAQRISLSEERFRLLAENMADVVVRIIDGRVSWISNSVERALNAPPGYWIGRQALDFITPQDRETYLSGIEGVARGETFIGRLRIRGADGVPHWVHLHAKPFHEADGTPNGLVGSFRVVDEEVATELRSSEQIADRDAQNRSLTRRLQDKTDRLLAELKSAARYVESILPGDLDGSVRVSSRYVPSEYLGGDSYDYRWVDDDHLVFYLVDVSGHGVESAMLSVSVHNMMRTGTFSQQKLLQPAAVLTELNRLFQMEKHGGNYFTIWYGVYQQSTRRLRYACAGHPPALAFSSTPDAPVEMTALTAAGLPIGTFEDTRFATETFLVPPKTEIMLYSDGAFELDPEAGRWDPKEFTELCTQMVSSSDWSVDDLISALVAKTTSGLFHDDCTVVRLILD